MSGLVRKLLVAAALDGLIIIPLGQKDQRPVQPVKISYKGAAIGPALGSIPDPEKGFEAFGIVGLLTVSTTSYLISITQRQQVAQIRGKPIYVITGVALTPLSSRKDAETSITSTKASLQKRMNDGNGVDETDSDYDEGEYSTAASDEVDEEGHSAMHQSTDSIDATIADAEHQRSSIAEDVIHKKGTYGRFAQNWFSKNGWAADRRRGLGLSTSESSTTLNSSTDLPATDNQETKDQEAPSAAPPAQIAAVEDLKAKTTSDTAALIPKLLRTTRLLFGSSRSFYFSYDHDITRSLANRLPSSGSEIPLYTQVDPLFFWNRSVIQPFIDAGQTSFVLPLMQGFVGQRTFTVEQGLTEPHVEVPRRQTLSIELDDLSVPPGTTESKTEQTDSDPDKTEDTSESFLLTLISRRSVKRSGLRYLRRGIDDDGNAANTVETEQILSGIDWSPHRKIISFLQIRGSIPVFFSQSPYSFKPVPHLYQSAENNFKAFSKHLENLSSRYGKIQVASLVEKHNNEAIVGDPFEKEITKYNNACPIDAQVGFEWWDFHAKTKGMKFENVKLLLDSMSEKLDSFGFNTELEGNIIQKQSGILRTNCMDCLDRTNVVQSACGRRALEIQLKDHGFDMSLQKDQATQWFNTLWADNGDAISKQYASSAALKGDFTRTRKRDYRGALTDLGLSITRFYSGIINDYFSQTAIDYLLGNVTALVFEDFESNMMSADPGVSMQKLRQQAIDVSQKLVIADEHEEMIGGWTMLTPHDPNTLKGLPFEEAVLLLTDSALYLCRFDWTIEKVSSFERVSLRHILHLKYGTYITSTLSAQQSDEKRNVGLVITYTPGAADITRVNTRSISSEPTRESADLLHGSTAVSPPRGADKPKPTRIVAFKALPSRSAVAAGQDLPRMSEIEQVKMVCEEIERGVIGARLPGPGGDTVVTGTAEEKASEGKKDPETSIVERADVISLAEARKNTGLLERVGFGLKRLVWA